MSKYLNMRQSAYDYLKGTGTYNNNNAIMFAELLGWKNNSEDATIVNISEVEAFLKVCWGTSFEFAKICKKLEDPFTIIDVPKEEEHLCKKCGSPVDDFTNSEFYVHLIHFPSFDVKPDLCPECFVKELKERELTPWEVDCLAEELFKRRQDQANSLSSYFRAVKLPEDIFTPKQILVVEAAVANLKQKAEQEEEKEIVQKYTDLVSGFINEAGLDPNNETYKDLKKILVVMYRDIDERLRKVSRSRSLSEARFG